MAHENNDPLENRWVDEHLGALAEPEGFRPDVAKARARLRGRQETASYWVHRTWAVAVIGVAALGTVAFPGPRAAAQRLWDRLTLGRVQVIQNSRTDLSDTITAAFEWHDLKRDEPVVVRDIAEAEQIAGFRLMLPIPGVLNETPKLSVIQRVVESTLPLHVAEIERALEAAGVSGVSVPKEWEGTTLVAERGPIVLAEYPKAGLSLSQSPPFKMTTPAGFPVGRFMEMAYQVFGKNATEARELSRKFVANPAWLLVFPGHDTVREVAVQSGEAVAAGGQGGMCFFWHTSDRIFVIGSDKMDEDRGISIANAMQ
jgi:hypothetical protein